MKCNCKDWKDNIERIDSILVINNLRTEIQYAGLPFKYCPWCSIALYDPNETWSAEDILRREG